MRILVLSDSHGDTFSLRCAIEQQPTAKVIIHLGDGENDMQSMGNLNGLADVIQVKGNCDWCSNAPARFVYDISGTKIYCTHGYAENVKYSETQLIEAAKGFNASIALYGHTHTPVTNYVDGLYVVNPGSVRDGSYAVIDLTAAGIVPVIMKVR